MIPAVTSVMLFILVELIIFLLGVSDAETISLIRLGTILVLSLTSYNVTAYILELSEDKSSVIGRIPYLCNMVFLRNSGLIGKVIKLTLIITPMIGIMYFIMFKPQDGLDILGIRAIYVLSTIPQAFTIASILEIKKPFVPSILLITASIFTALQLNISTLNSIISIVLNIIPIYMVLYSLINLALNLETE